MSTSTEEKIKTAFLSIMENNAVERITVSAIAENAGVARSTVYQYYDDINGLLESVASDYASALFQMMRKGRGTVQGIEGFRRAYTMIAHYALERKLLLRQLMSNIGFMQKTADAFRDILYEDYLKMDIQLPQKALYYCASYLANGGLAVISDMVSSDDELDPNVEAELATGMLEAIRIITL